MRPGRLGRRAVEGTVVGVGRGACELFFGGGKWQATVKKKLLTYIHNKLKAPPLPPAPISPLPIPGLPGCEGGMEYGAC